MTVQSMFSESIECKWECNEMTSNDIAIRFPFFSALSSAHSLSTITTIDSFIITYWACIRQTYTHQQSSHLFIVFNVQCSIYSTIFCCFHFFILYLPSIECEYRPFSPFRSNPITPSTLKTIAKTKDEAKKKNSF